MLKVRSESFLIENQKFKKIIFILLQQNLDDFEDEEQVLNMEGLNKLNIMTKVNIILNSVSLK